VLQPAATHWKWLRTLLHGITWQTKQSDDAWMTQHAIW
jgi:hypothetical protein